MQVGTHSHLRELGQCWQETMRSAACKSCTLRSHARRKSKRFGSFLPRCVDGFPDAIALTEVDLWTTGL